MVTWGDGASETGISSHLADIRTSRQYSAAGNFTATVTFCNHPADESDSCCDTLSLPVHLRNSSWLQNPIFRHPHMGSHLSINVCKMWEWFMLVTCWNFQPTQQKFVIWCVTLIVDVLNCNHNNYYYNHIYMYVCYAAIFELLPTIITHCMHQTITWYLRAIWTNAQHFLNVTHNLSLFGWGHTQNSSGYSPCS